jgi:hypothetical protein
VVGDRDNSFETATRIYQEQPAEGYIHTGDVDWYLYESTGAEWLRI